MPGITGCGKTHDSLVAAVVGIPAGDQFSRRGQRPRKATPGATDAERVELPFYPAAQDPLTPSGSSLQARRLPGALPPATNSRPFTAAGRRVFPQPVKSCAPSKPVSSYFVDTTLGTNLRKK